MKVQFNVGYGKYNSINEIVDVNGYVELVKTIYNKMNRYPTSFETLDHELRNWYELACEKQPNLSKKDYFDINEVEFSEENAKKFLNRCNGSNERFGFNYEIID